MKIYVYLDESGSIHKNSNTKYFAVGGYFIFKEDKNKATSYYKKINKEIKNLRNIPIDKEIKSYNMLDEEKKKILSTIQDIDINEKRNNTFKYILQLFSKSTFFRLYSTYFKFNTN